MNKKRLKKGLKQLSKDFMDGENFVKLGEAAEFHNVSVRTIYRWRDDGKIPYRKTPSGQFLYKIRSIDRNEKNKYIYIRVSSRKQKDDLQRQKEFASKQFPSHKVISDIGSGLNFKRPGLRKLLKLVMSSCVEEIVIASKDRLCRFGYDLICDENDTKLLVLDKDSNLSRESEFVRDVLSIIQIYTCKWNGQRRYTCKNKENQVEINIQSKTDVQRME